jgi:hypothetical protein
LRRLASVLLIAILTTLVAQPSYSDDVTINLDSNTPYVDIPVTITEPVDATISTVTGTPQTNPGFIDSWIEVWQGLNKLRADDDSAHSASNVLASIINMPLQVGEYFIRATSFAWMASNKTQFPTGSYLLSTNLTVAIPSPTPSELTPTPTVSPEPTPSESVTPSPSPTPTQTSSSPTPEPTPEPSSPSPSPSDIPLPSASPEVPVVPVQEPDEPDLAPFEEFLEPSPLPLLDVPDTLEEVVDSSFNDFPSSYENDLPSLDEEVLEPVDLFVEDVSSIDEILDLLSFLPELSLENLQETLQEISETITAAFESIPGGEQVLAAAEFVGEQFTAAAEFATNLGTEFTPEEREQAQQVVLGAVIVTQLSTATRRIK